MANIPDFTSEHRTGTETAEDSETGKRLAVEVPEEIRQIVKAKAALRGITMGEYITELVQLDQARATRGSEPRAPEKKAS